MKMRGKIHKIVGLAIAGSLLILIFSILLPPSMAINLDIGSVDPTNGIGIGDNVTFSNVGITIKGIERIPLTELNFTIFCANTHQEKYNIKFNVLGNKTSGDTGIFIVELISPTFTQISNWITNGIGYDYDYGQRWGLNPGEGYGYGNNSEPDITLTYQIIFTTQSGQGGPYYGKLFATATLNSITHIYNSSCSETFQIGIGTRASSRAPEQALALVASQETLQEIEDALSIHLELPFNAKDTDGDNLVDEFTDPNGVLTVVRILRDGAKVLFLLSIDNDNLPEFLWNSADDTIQIITIITGVIIETQINTVEETITVLVNVDKDGWAYIEVEDQYAEYPEFAITVQTSDERSIDPEYIWRDKGKIYFLDDSVIQYHIIYDYDILEPIFSPADGAEFSNDFPSVTITYYEEVTILTCNFNNVDVKEMLSTVDLKTYTFKPTYSIGAGAYELSITVEDNEGSTRTSTAGYIVNLPFTYTSEEFPWLIITILAIILIIAAIVVILKLFIL
jgi:hypothetical protein